MKKKKFEEHICCFDGWFSICRDDSTKGQVLRGLAKYAIFRCYMYIEIHFHIFFVISGLSICLALRSYRSSLWACAVKINHNTVLFLIELALHDGKRWSSLCSSCCKSGLFESLYLQFVVIWKCFVYRSPKPQQIEMKLYCLGLSKSAFDAVNSSVATKSDRSLALVPLSRWRTRSGSYFTTLTGIFGIMHFVIIL